MTTYPNQAGIPGGGLFNDIFDAHYAQGGNAGRRKTNQDANTQQLGSDELGVEAGCGLIALIIFVFLMLPALMQGPWLFVGIFAAPPLMWIIGRKLILARRNNKAPAQPASSVSLGPTAPAPVETFPSLYKGGGRVDLATLKTQFAAVHEEMERTGNVPENVNTDVAGFPNFFGAACEVTTARALRSIADCFVINDIAIIKPDGKVTANIDHLACFHNTGTYVMVDSKFWSTPPTFSRYRGGVSVDADGPHARAVATCIYEASFLPHPPAAIVFAVRGKAAQSLQPPVSVEYYPTFDFNGNMEMKRVPFPVLFIDHRHIQQAVSTLGRGGAYAGAQPHHVASSGTNVLELTGKHRVRGNTLVPTKTLRF